MEAREIQDLTDELVLVFEGYAHVRGSLCECTRCDDARRARMLAKLDAYDAKRIASLALVEGAEDLSSSGVRPAAPTLRPAALSSHARCA